MQLSRFDKFVFWFVIIDNLFLPYFWVKCVSYSFPIVFIWYLNNKNICQFDGKSIRIIISLSTISTLIGSMIYPEYLSDDIVLLLNLMSSLFSYQLFRFVNEATGFRLTAKINFTLFLFVTFAFLLSILFYVDNGMYETIRHFFNARIGSSGEDLYTGMIRYGYYWSDENNIGYMVSAVSLFLIVSDSFSMLKKYLLLIMSGIIVVATMSSGAIAAYFAMLCCFIYYNIIKTGGEKSGLVRYAIMTTFLFICIYYSSLLLSSDVYQNMMLRMEGKELNGDNRQSIYQRVWDSFDWFKYILFGYGGRTIINGKYLSTHNGILHFIIAYGYIVCYCYIKLIFSKLKVLRFKYWLWRIPVFIGFFLNIMIAEDKLHVLIMLMLAFDLNRQIEDKSNPVT